MGPKDFAELDMVIQESMKKTKKPVAKPSSRGLYMDFVGPGLKVAPTRRNIINRSKVAEQLKPVQKTARKELLQPPIVTTVRRVSATRPLLNGRGAILEDVEIEEVTRETVSVREVPAARPVTGGAKMAVRGGGVVTGGKTVIERRVGAKSGEIGGEKAPEKTPVAKRSIEEIVTPDANNYALGGRSPFLTDAKIEKRPLGSFVEGGNAYEIKSTKNIYSQRDFTKRNGATDMDRRPVIVSSVKKKSGWAWAITTLAVIAIGGGIGVLLYFAFAN